MRFAHENAWGRRGFFYSIRYSSCGGKDGSIVLTVGRAGPGERHEKTLAPAVARTYDPAMNTYDAVALFSGGLDSLLAVKTLEEQGLRVKCLHFISPFFGKPALVEHWKELYRLDMVSVDVGELFVRMLRARPEHGFGKVLNPCVDCKILMLWQANMLMEAYGASCVVSGEVLGQRPMSQRRDTLNIIKRESGLGDRLLRPLSALLLPSTEAEREGRVDRSLLHDIAGRGRKKQLALAARFGISEIPTPAGGCRLAERENACRYWPVLTQLPEPTAADFHLSNTGRQFWADVPEGAFWLCIGRNAADNEALERQARSGDLLFRLQDFPGPLGLGRRLAAWPEALVEDASRLVASFSPRAQGLDRVAVKVRSVGAEEESTVAVRPGRETCLSWGVRPWEDVRQAIRSEATYRLCKEDE